MQIPGYKIERKLGQGGMAEVYLAIQESLGRQVALKITSPWQSQDPVFRERFMQEGRIVATLNHPNIVTIHEIGQVGEQYFIAMEYVSGKSLTEKIREGMTFEESVQTIKRVARALAYAHNGGFLHRDIKPSNILFRDNQYAVLADFGIARALTEDDTRLTQTGMSPGSPAYMSPEQVNGLNLDARSDQYSLGIVFYEMLTGERPYVGNSATATAILHLTAPVPQIPHPYESLQPIFDRLLAKTPEERFPDEEALIQALDEPDSVEFKPRTESDSQAATVLARTQVRMEKTRVATSVVQGSTGSKGVKGDDSRKWLLRAGAAGLGIVAFVGAMFWFQTDHLAQDDNPDVIASLPADEAKKPVIQETDSKGAESAPTSVEEPVETQPVDAESKTNPMPEPNRPSVVSSNPQEPMDSKQADIASKVAPMPGLNGQASNTPDIQASDESSTTKMKAAQEPAFSEEQPDLSDIQKHTDAPTVNIKAEATQASESSKEPTRLPEVGEQDNQIVAAPMESDKEPEEDLNAQESAGAEISQDGEKDESLTNMLAVADEQMAAERYMEPAGDNAFETYTEVLAEEANNETAIQGLSQIAEYYEQQARLKQAAGEFEQSLSLLNLALKAAPKNARLITLNNEVSVQYEKQQTRQQIDSLMQKAKSQMAHQLLARPKGNNAYESYQAILALDAGYQPAQKGIQEIANRYQQFAQNKSQAGEISAGLAMVDRGLEVAPEHAGLLNLRKKMADQLDEKQASQAEIKQLLAIAQRQLDANQLTQPKGKNARESYNAVLKLAPENQQARTGLKAISQRYEALVRDKQSAGETAEAFGLVEEGLQAFPRHSGLRALYKEIASQIEVAKRAQTTRIEPQPVVKKPKKKKSATRVFGTF